MNRPVTLLIAAVFLCAPLAAEQALFRNAMIGYGGGSVVDMKTADVNHDGKPDVILLQASEATNACSLITLFGNGDGSFRAPVQTPINSAGAALAIGDLDGDGNVDVVMNAQYTILETYRGNGDGSFTLLSSKDTGNIISRLPLVLTDLNGDGKLDLISGTFIRGEFATALVTYRGNGDGTFADGITQPGPYVAPMNDIAIGDFNGDGRTDVIESSSEQRIATGNGDGTFNPSMPISFDSSHAIAAGDFNGDGKLDYISIGLPTSVHLGNGNGTFTNGATYDIGGALHPLCIDFDGDGKLDIIAPGNDLVVVMHGNGDGTFSVRSYVANSSALVVADFDGDHRPDVLAASDPALVLLHGNGDGTLRGYRKSFLAPNPAASSDRSDFAGIAVADFNGDGKPDVVSRSDRIIVMLNSGDGGFGPPRPLALPPGVTEPLAFATGDVNGDGRADIVVTGSKLWTYLGNGDGTFVTAGATEVPAYFRLSLKDMNGDGKLDAVLGRWDMDGQLALGNGDGTFAAPAALPGNPSQIADFNGDGRPDFVSNNVIDGYTIYLNNGNGSFTAGATVTNTLGALAAGDFNGDGKIDLVEQMYNSDIRMRLGKGDGTFNDLPPLRLTNLPGGAFVAEAVTADFDGDGKLDLAFSNTVMLGNGDGTFRAIIPCVVSRNWSDLAAADVDGNGSTDLLLLDPQNGAVNALLTRTAAAGTTPLSLTLNMSPSPLHPGEEATVTATATTPSTFIPSGGLRIDADGSFVGFAEWNDHRASLSWTQFSVGDHTIVASYVGDDVFPATSVSLTRTAVKLDSLLSLVVSPASPQQQQPASIRASVFPRPSSRMIAGGFITIRDGETILFSGPYSQVTPLIVNYRFPTAGPHTLTLDYTGNANFNPATATFAQSVTKAIATVELSGSPASPLIAGQTLKLQALVSAYINPTGAVTFRDNGSDIATAPMIGSVASITIQPPAGNHSYSATYNGGPDLDPASTDFTRDYVVIPSPCGAPAPCGRRRAVH